MTDLSTSSTPNGTIHSDNRYIKLHGISSFCLRWGGQLAVSACRSENQICKVINCDTGGVNLQMYPGKSENCLWYLHVSSMCWYLLISSYYLTVSNGHSLTALKSIELTQCSGSFKWGGVNLKIYPTYKDMSSLAI